MWQIAPVSAELMVHAEDRTDEGGAVSGRVLAVAIAGDGADGGAAPGSTWLLVADERKSGPVWVAQRDVTEQRLGR
jgi:hypothetical protein